MRLPDAEIIVVDGGSSDRTREELQQLRDRFSLGLLRTPRGRAIQMNAGARLATGDTLLFLHADSRLPVGAVRLIAHALRDPQICGGCFRLRFPRREWIYRVSDSLGNVAVDLFRIALGDHGIFCRKKIFFFAGGYPPVPLMEDAEFYRRLRRFGRVRQLPAAVETSPRRYEALGRYRTTAFYLLILALYLGGVHPRFLARCYERFATPRGDRAVGAEFPALKQAAH
jgi:rSAM/selenodomain-associated transferase 2